MFAGGCQEVAKIADAFIERAHERGTARPLEPRLRVGERLRRLREACAERCCAAGWAPPGI
jgi:hypothetical protein